MKTHAALDFQMASLIHLVNFEFTEKEKQVWNTFTFMIAIVNYSKGWETIEHIPNYSILIAPCVQSILMKFDHNLTTDLTIIAA